MYITFFRIDNKFVCSSTYFVIFSRKERGLASSERATHHQSIAGAGGTHYGVQVTDCQQPQAEAWGYRHGASYGARSPSLSISPGRSPLTQTISPRVLHPLAEPLPRVLSVHPDHLRHSPPERRLVLAAPTTGCKSLIANHPRLKPGVIDTAPPTGRSLLR